MFKVSLEAVNNFEIREGVKVEGTNSKLQEVLVEKIDDFFKSKNPLVLDEQRANFYIDIDNGANVKVKGPGTPRRVEIQGAEGLNHVRVAFQIGHPVLAQVVLPRKKIISVEQFKHAFKQSGIKAKEFIFGSSKDVIYSQGNTKTVKKK
ncbi:MAG: hypothetical protein V4494_01430 [Chlamydiota bacterium]